MCCQELLKITQSGHTGSLAENKAQLVCVAFWENQSEDSFTVYDCKHGVHLMP